MLESSVREKEREFEREKKIVCKRRVYKRKKKRECKRGM